MFVANSVVQLQARSEILLHCQEYIARPKEQVDSLYATRSRLEYGDFQRSKEQGKSFKIGIVNIYSYGFL